jgi:hypothetical protein
MNTAITDGRRGDPPVEWGTSYDLVAVGISKKWPGMKPGQRYAGRFWPWHDGSWKHTGLALGFPLL